MEERSSSHFQVNLQPRASSGAGGLSLESGMSLSGTFSETSIGLHLGSSPLAAGFTRPSPTAISSFACSPADMQLIDAIITHTQNETESDMLPQCSFCGRLSLTHPLNAIHSEESCLANSASLASRKLASLAHDDTLEKINASSSKFSQKKGTSSRRSRKKFAPASGPVEEQDLAGSMISSMVISQDGLATSVPKRRRKPSLSKKTTTGQLSGDSHMVASIAAQLSDTANTHLQQQQQQQHLASSSSSAVSLWIPVLTDASHLVTAILEAKTAASFSLQRSRMQMVFAANHLMAKKKRAPAFVEAVSQGLDHVIRTSLVGRRRIAAAASASASATTVTPVSSSISTSSNSAPLSPTSTPISTQSPPPETNIAGPMTIKKRRVGSNGARSSTRSQKQPQAPRPTATALSMPEI